MTNTVTVAHNFETGHRLPHLGGKCQSLHGHSWWAEVTFTGPVNRPGTVAEFGALKDGLRHWVDTYLDHGCMLGDEDPLADLLTQARSKVYRFGLAAGAGAESLARDLHWPTVENVAILLGRVGQRVVDEMPGVTVTRCRVRETQVNTAEWVP